MSCRETNPSISVVIVNWNSKNDLERCLTSLSLQTDLQFEIVVVDNGSVDGSVEMVRRICPQAIIVEAGENLGFAEGSNRGILASSGDWVFTLNNDTIVDVGLVAIAKTVIADVDADVGMIQAKMVFLHDPSIINSTGVVLTKNGTPVDRDFECVDDGAQRRDDVFCVCAGAALYRRKMLDTIRLEAGFFDRHYFMYYEDVDLGWRARLAGWKAHYVADMVVQHVFHGSSKRKSRWFVSEHCRKNRTRSLIKNASLGYFISVLPKTIFDTMWLLVALKSNGPGVLLKIFRQSIKTRREINAMIRASRKDIEHRFMTGPSSALRQGEKPQASWSTSSS